MARIPGESRRDGIVVASRARVGKEPRRGGIFWLFLPARTISPLRGSLLGLGSAELRTPSGSGESSRQSVTFDSTLAPACVQVVFWGSEPRTGRGRGAAIPGVEVWPVVGRWGLVKLKRF